MNNGRTIKPSFWSGEQCFWCSKPLMYGWVGRANPELKSSVRSRDHFIPKSSGGHGFTVPSCRECNGLKANMEPMEFRNKFRRNVSVEKIEATLLLAENAAVADEPNNIRYLA